MDSVTPHQTVQIWTYTVNIWHKDHFHTKQPPFLTLFFMMQSLFEKMQKTGIGIICIVKEQNNGCEVRLKTHQRYVWSWYSYNQGSNNKLVKHLSSVLHHLPSMLGLPCMSCCSINRDICWCYTLCKCYLISTYCLQVTVPFYSIDQSFHSDNVLPSIICQVGFISLISSLCKKVYPFT